MLYRYVTTLNRSGRGADIQTIDLEMPDVSEARRAAFRALCEMIGDFGPEGGESFAIRVTDPDGVAIYEAQADYRETTPAKR